jgi:hypothetical protein
MSDDQIFWISLLAKLLLTAGIVVTASVVAERAGPLVGGLVATLPVTFGPAYVFLSLDHDAAYVAIAARNGLAVHAFTGLFTLVYAVLAQSRRLVISMGGAIGCWIVLALFARSVEWSLAGAMLLNLIVYPGFIWFGRTMVAAEIPRMVRAWYELPMRTLLVCALMALLLATSSWAGPEVTGIIAVYPISSTSLMIILQHRLGGKAAAAVMTSSLWGLCGVALGLATLSYLVEQFGAAPALATALVVCVGWSLGVWTFRGRRRRASMRTGASTTIGSSQLSAAKPSPQSRTARAWRFR